MVQTACRFAIAFKKKLPTATRGPAALAVHPQPLTIDGLSKKVVGLFSSKNSIQHYYIGYISYIEICMYVCMQCNAMQCNAIVLNCPVLQCYVRMYSGVHYCNLADSSSPRANLGTFTQRTQRHLATKNGANGCSVRSLWRTRMVPLNP